MNINLKIRSKDNYYTCTFALVTGSKYIVSFEVEWCNLSALGQKIRKPTLNALYKCTCDEVIQIIHFMWYCFDKWYQNKTIKLYYKIDIMAFVRVYRCMISSLKSVYLSKNTFFMRYYKISVSFYLMITMNRYRYVFILTVWCFQLTCYMHRML